MNKQELVLTRFCGKIRPDVVEDYTAVGGFRGLHKALNMGSDEIINEVKKSQLLGRGGAAYPVGKKWEHLYHIQGTPKYVVCNADEGEPGTFKDKLLLEQNTMAVIEGMTIAGYVFGSRDGYIYIRDEYHPAQAIMKRAIAAATKANFLGQNILGSNFSFTIHVMSGAGAYVCGENSALLNSIEGKAGRPRIKPPHLAEVGLFLQPTLVNNVESLAVIPYIVENGGEYYHSLGTDFSGGTKLICLSGNIARPGTYEIPFGITLREIIYDLGQGIPGGYSLKMLHLGGQSGPCMSADLLDTPYCYQALRKVGLNVGSGAIVVVDERQCIIDYLMQVTKFFVHESCGQCTPCREGNRQILHILTKMSRFEADQSDMTSLKRLRNLLRDASFCGLGQSAATALTSCLTHFSSEFEEHLHHVCTAGVCACSVEEAI